MIAARQIFLGRGGGAKVPTAADYVQDGLVSMWDGIENVGFGEHNDNPEYWIDLVGSDSIRNYGSNQSPVYPNWFNGTALVGKPYYNSLKSTGLYNVLVGAEKTYELLFTRTGSGNCVGFPELIGGNYLSVTGFVGTRLLVYFEGNGFYVDPPTTTTPYTMLVTMAVKDGYCDVYVNGQYVDRKASSGTSAQSNNRLFFGQNLNLVNDTNYFAIWTHCIRVYDGCKSGSDIAANYAIDKARFNLP